MENIQKTVSFELVYEDDETSFQDIFFPEFHPRIKIHSSKILSNKSGEKKEKGFIQLLPDECLYSALRDDEETKFLVMHGYIRELMYEGPDLKEHCIYPCGNIVYNNENKELVRVDLYGKQTILYNTKFLSCKFGKNTVYLDTGKALVVVNIQNVQSLVYRLQAGELISDYKAFGSKGNVLIRLEDGRNLLAQYINGNYRIEEVFFFAEIEDQPFQQLDFDVVCSYDGDNIQLFRQFNFG